MRYRRCEMILYDNEDSRAELSLGWRVLDLHCECYCTFQTLDPCFAGAPSAQRLVPWPVHSLSGAQTSSRGSGDTKKWSWPLLNTSFTCCIANMHIWRLWTLPRWIEKPRREKTCATKRECCAVMPAFDEPCIVYEVMAGKMQLRHQLQQRPTKLLQLTCKKD